MDEKKAYDLLYECAEQKKKILLELKDGQKIYCYPKSFDESDFDDLGFNFKIAPESEGLDWMRGTKFFCTPFSTMVNITLV